MTNATSSMMVSRHLPTVTKASWIKMRLALMIFMTTQPLLILTQLTMTIWKLDAFFENRQQPVSWDCDDFLDGVSEEFANTQNVDWDHPEIDDEYSEDSFAVENTQPHRSL